MCTESIEAYAPPKSSLGGALQSQWGCRGVQSMLSLQNVFFSIKLCVNALTD